MDDKITRLKSVEACEIFARNATRLGRPDLAEQARLRAIEIRAGAHAVTEPAEKECLQAIYAYEEVLAERNGRRIRANYTWRMVREKGIIAAVESLVSREINAAGYTRLAEMGLEEFSFEAVVLRYPEFFSDIAVKNAKQRLSR